MGNCEHCGCELNESNISYYNQTMCNECIEEADYEGNDEESQ